ncbi:MAG: PAS domain S-box protein [Bacteroidetes bacterium]|nr:PAS domain S-box protein [Bacteroidota bacterium]
MNKINLLLLVVAGLLYPQTGYSQHYFTKSYTIENGLPTRVVNDVCQDGSGDMWFATHRGISSFDGFSFTNYDPSRGLPQQNFLKVKCDERGTIWGVPAWLLDTIVFRKNDKWERILPATTRKDIEATSFDIIYVDDNPVICVGSNCGIDIYQNGRWNHITLSDDYRNNIILSVTAINGKFYILTKFGVSIAVMEQKHWILKIFFKCEGQAILAIKFEHPGKPEEKLWILNHNRLSYRQFGKMTLFQDGFSLPAPDISIDAYLAIDENRNIFFGNNWAKYFISGNRDAAAPLMVRNGFSSNGATSVFVDREQNIWFTDTRGIDKINNVLQMNYFENDGLLDNEVTAIVELKDGKIVLGHNTGLTVYDQHSYKRIRFPGSDINLGRVLNMMQDNLGNVWFASASLGFGQLKPDGTVKWYRVDSTEMAATIHQDALGKIWLGTNRKLYYLDKGKFIPYEHNEKINCPFRKIFASVPGEIVGTSLYGLFKIYSDGVKRILLDDEVKTQSVFSYYRNKEGTEFVGTLNGLCVLENDRIRKFTKNGISIDSPVYFIFQDHDDNYWLGSDNGLYQWDGKNRLEKFSLQNGLAGRETNRSAGLVDSHGKVWVGTDMGLSCFLPGFSKLKARTPVVKLLDLEDNRGVRYPLGEKSTIGFYDNTLFFHFRGISFVNEDLLIYRYKLEGFDQEWQFVKQANLDKVKYAGIHPGNYQFVVQARNDAGKWSEVSKSGTITINSPVYQSWWFILLIFLTICVIIFSFVKIVLQRKSNRALEIEITERRRSEAKTLQTLQALHVSEVKYRELVESAVDGILLGSKEGFITGANSYMQTLAGRDMEDLAGMQIDVLFNADSLNDVPLRYDLLEKGDMVVSRRVVCQPHGARIPVEMHTKMMPDGTYQSIFHDITEQIKAEKALQESRELYKLITDKMTDVVWLLDLNGKSTFVSKSVEQFSGFSIEEYLEQTAEDRFAPDSVVLVQHLFRNELPRLMAEPEKLNGYSNTQCLEYVCKNGGTKWGELLMTPYLGENGEWIGIHGVTRDITDRKLSEEALKEKAMELERFNSLMIGRELKMIELKKEINELLVHDNKPEKYKVHG